MTRFWDRSKFLFVSVLNMEKVNICVGGTAFVTTKHTLSKFPQTRLAELDTTSDHFDQSTNEYYFDRDPVIFGCILNMYRTDELHFTEAVCGNAVRKELEFWKLSESVISPCCWRTLHNVDQEKAIMESLDGSGSACVNDLSWSCGLSWRPRMWRIIEQPNSSRIAKVWHFIFAHMIFLSAIVYCLDSLPHLRHLPQNGTEEYDIYQKNKASYTPIRILLHLFSDSNKALLYLDKICLVFFTAELILHLVVCPNFKMFFRSFLNWIDIITVLVGLTVSFLEIGKNNDAYADEAGAFYVYLLLKSIYVIRLFRVFRLMQSNSNLRIILLALNECKKELFLLVFSVFILAVIFGSFEFFCEDTNPQFESIPKSIWWAVITMTTVGYGDMYPKTVAGYSFGILCAFFGILALALPIAVIANHFNDYYTLNQWRSHNLKRRLKTCSKT